LKGCHSLAPDTELEVGNKEIRSFKKENREGYDPKMVRRVIEKGGEEEEEVEER
jgi:hypothetical protein